jgi:tetratricopeptide (TPR) repeat protein
MSRHQQGAAIIIPIVLEPCDWSWLPFAKFQAFPKDALAVTSWTNQNEAFVDVATGIRKVAHDMLAERQGELRRKEADREKYKAKVEQVLSISTNGEISVADRDTLEELRESLDLTAEEAQQAENSAYKPFIDRAEKQDKYKKTLLKYIENYPFSEDIIKQLENRQRDLGLKTDDIEQVTRPILAEADKKYQEKLQVKGVERRSEIEEESGNPNSLSSNLDAQKKYQEAVDCYRKEIENATFNNELGRSLYYQGRYEEAIEFYQKAIEISSRNAIFYKNLGDSLASQGKHEEATKCYRKAIEIDPNVASIHCNLGVILASQEKHEEAIKCYQKAIGIGSNDATIHENLEFSLFRLQVQSQKKKFLGLF